MELKDNCKIIKDNCEIIKDNYEKITLENKTKNENRLLLLNGIEDDFCLVCFEQNSVIVLCINCKYKYCNDCAKKLNNKCSICLRNKNIKNINTNNHYLDLYYGISYYHIISLSFLLNIFLGFFFISLFSYLSHNLMIFFKNIILF